MSTTVHGQRYSAKGRDSGTVEVWANMSADGQTVHLAITSLPGDRPIVQFRLTRSAWNRLVATRAPGESVTLADHTASAIEKILGA